MEVVEMTTATAPRVTRDILEVRWHMATTDVARFQGESGWSSVNHKRLTRLLEGIEELGALLVDEVGDHVRPGGPSEQETLASLVWDELNPYIRDRLLAWAESIESKRAERRAGAAS